MRERILTAWIVRSVLLMVAGVSIAAGAILGPDGDDGQLSFRLVVFGIAVYVVSRILDKR